MSPEQIVISKHDVKHNVKITGYDFPPDIGYELPSQASFAMMSGNTENADAFSPQAQCYWSPEKANRTPMTAQSEVYTLGAILYEAVSGDRVVKSSDQDKMLEEIMAVKPPRTREINPLVDSTLDRICMTCLQKNPKDRWYRTVEELAADLDKWCTGGTIALPPASTPSRLMWWFAGPPAEQFFLRRRQWWLRGNLRIALLVMFLALVPIPAWLVWSKGESVQEAKMAQNVGKTATYVANQVADRVLSQLKEYSRLLLRTLKKEEFLRIWAKATAANNGDLDPDLSTFLSKELDAYNADYVSQGHSKSQKHLVFSSLVAMDKGAKLIAMSPEANIGPVRSLIGRDYYHGAKRRSAYGEFRAVHISHVYFSASRDYYKFAISAAFKVNDDFDGVLAVTLEQGEQLSLAQFPNHLVALAGPYDKHKITDKPPKATPEYAVFVHPAYSQVEDVAIFDGKTPLPSAQERSEFDFDRRASDKLEPNLQYTDPVVRKAEDVLNDAEAMQKDREKAQKIKDTYGKRWIAGFAPVANTDLMVIVQEDYKSSVAEPMEQATTAAKTTFWVMLIAISLAVLLVGVLANQQSRLARRLGD